MPRQVVLSNPSTSTFSAAAIEVAGHWIGVFLTLALLRGLDPLDRIPFGLDANATSILEDDHGCKCPDHEERGNHPHGELLEPRPIRWIILREVSIVHCVKYTCWQQSPVLPLVA